METLEEKLESMEVLARPPGAWSVATTSVLQPEMQLEQLGVPRAVERELELALALVLVLLWVEPILPSWVTQRWGLPSRQTTSRKRTLRRVLHPRLAKNQQWLVRRDPCLSSQFLKLPQAKRQGRRSQRNQSVHQAKRQKQLPHLAGLPLT